MTSLEALAKRWNSEADTVERRYGDRTTANLLRTVAAELTEAMREADDELLTLSEAADSNPAPRSSTTTRRFSSSDSSLKRCRNRATTST